MSNQAHDGFYTVDVRCNNCNHVELSREIYLGVSISNVICSTCKCKTLERKI